jgi:anti-anti-sigma factor
MTASVVILKPTGVLNAQTSKQLYQQVYGVLQQQARIILIDCEELEFVDSSGLGVLVRILKSTDQAGARLALCTLNEQFKTLLNLTDMEDMFEIFASQVHFRLSL